MKEPLLIEKEVVQALLNYLGTRPYNEVAQAVAVLAQLKPLENKQGLEKEEKTQ